jgi:glycosyltransferase involved in cell wall biosynthesis
MMRAGDKLASYAIIAEALASLRTPGWTATIAGDGPARPEVQRLMADLAPRVRFLGACTAAQMAALYEAVDVFFWPGVNEAFGMVYLEAQARGVPVVAQDRPGVRDVLAPGTRPAPDAGPAALAQEIDRLLADSAEREAQGAAARAHVGAHHLLGAAADVLERAIQAAGA